MEKENKKIKISEENKKLISSGQSKIKKVLQKFNTGFGVFEEKMEKWGNKLF